MRSSLAAPFCCVVLIAMASGSVGPPDGRPEREGAAVPSVLLLTLDTWRWDHIGASDSGRVETPALDALARGGIYIREAVTPCPLTTPAHASLLTGRGLLAHGVMDCSSYRLRDGLGTLATAFRSNGWRTAAFLSSETLKARYGLDKGFQLYDDGGMAEPRKGSGARRDGGATLDEAERYLDGLGAGDRAFLWVHFFDMHTPYAPRPGLDARYPGRPYAAQAAYVDALVGRLVKRLDGDGARAWKIAIAGDHGEGLGDKGEAEHGIGLYRATMSVPLIFHPVPRGMPTPDGPVGLVDVAPTLMEWAGLPGIPDGEGTSLFRSPGRERTLACLTVLPTLTLGVNPVLGVRRGEWMYLRHGVEELYDMERDPGQTADRSGDPSAAGALRVLRRASAALLPDEAVSAALSPSLTVTGEEEQRLRSLGCLGGRAPAGAKYQSADLRDVLRDWGALEALKSGSDPGPAAEKDYRILLSRYPRSASLAKDFGILLIRQGRFPEALSIFQQSREHNPDDLGILSNLGSLLAMEGRGPEAEEALSRALLLREGSSEIHKNLGALYTTVLERPDDAARHFRRCLELDPREPERDRIEDWLQERSKEAERP